VSTSIDSSADRRRTIGSLLGYSLRNGSAVWLIAVCIVLFSFTAPDTFPTVLTLRIVLSDQVSVGLLALAILVPMCAHQYDFSVGAQLGLGMATTAVLVTKGTGVVLASVLAVALTTALGAVNGFFVVKLNVSSFITALGVSQVATALALVFSQNQQVTPKLPSWFANLTQGKLFGFTYDVYYLFGIALILWYVLEHTAVGRSLFAAGGNPAAARLAGVRVDRLTWGSLICSGFLAGLGGVLLVSKIGLYSQEYGPNYLFPAFAAVFFGATQLKGRMNAWGTLIALYALGTAVAGLQLTFFNSQYWITPLFNGVALLVAVSLASRRYAGRAYRMLRKGKRVQPPDSSTPSEPSLQQDPATV
jgi:ribose transport system permease protein